MDMLSIALLALLAIVAVVAGIYVIRPEKEQSKEKGPHSPTALF